MNNPASCAFIKKDIINKTTLINKIHEIIDKVYDPTYKISINVSKDYIFSGHFLESNSIQMTF